MTSGPWFTDGLIVWAHSAGGPAIAAARNLSPAEGTFAPVEDVEQQRANMTGIAALPTLARAVDRLLSFNEPDSLEDQKTDARLREDHAAAWLELREAAELLATPASPP
jgi:hypothetical protein